MDPCTAAAAVMAVGLATGVAAWIAGWAASWTRWQRLATPWADPGAAALPAGAEARLADLLDRFGPDTADDAVELCLTPKGPWRAGARRLLPRVEADAADRPDCVDARARLALVLAWMTEHDRADALLEQVPADHWCGCVARSFRYRLRGDDDRADHAMAAAMALAPPERRPHLARVRARQLELLGRPQDAAVAWTAAADLRPDDPEPLERRARLLWWAGRFREARQASRQASRRRGTRSPEGD